MDCLYSAENVAGSAIGIDAEAVTRLAMSPNQSRRKSQEPQQKVDEMTAKPETAAEVLAEMRNRVARFEAMSMPIPAEELTSALDRLERALSAQGTPVRCKCPECSSENLSCYNSAHQLMACNDCGQIIETELGRLNRLSSQGEVVVTRAEDGEIVMVSRQDCDGNTIGIIASTTHAGGKAQGEAVAEVYERFECKRDSLGEAYRESAGPALRFVGEGFPIGTKLYTHPAPARVTEEMKAEVNSLQLPETNRFRFELIDNCWVSIGLFDEAQVRAFALSALTAALEADHG